METEMETEMEVGMKMDIEGDDLSRIYVWLVSGGLPAYDIYVDDVDPSVDRPTGPPTATAMTWKLNCGECVFL